MIYVLPTRASRAYRGKYPDAIHSVSFSGTDKDGNRAIHLETNAGQRLTASYDLLDMPRCNETQNYLGLNWRLFVRSNVAEVAMSQAEYDVWLTAIRAARPVRLDKVTF